MVDEDNKDAGKIYEIKIQEYLDTQWSEWFYGMTISREPDGATILCGPLPDQTVLHSVLGRIRDMNLRLVSVNLIGSDGKPVHDEVKGMGKEKTG